jgi:hypothetical protein
VAHVQELGKIRRLLVDNLGQPWGVLGKHGQLLGRDMPDARVRHTELYGPPRQNTAVFADREDVLQPIAAGLLGGVTAFRQFCVSTLFPLRASEWRAQDDRAGGARSIADGRCCYRSLDPFAGACS